MGTVTHRQPWNLSPGVRLSIAIGMCAFLLITRPWSNDDPYVAVADYATAGIWLLVAALPARSTRLRALAISVTGAGLATMMIRAAMRVWGT